MKLPPHRLAEGLQRALKPVFLVAGPELLLREEAVDQIRTTVRQAGVTQNERWQVDRSFDWEQLDDSGSSLSLFAERKLLELRLPTGKPGPKGAKAIGQKVEQLCNESTASESNDMLLVVAEAWDMSSEKTAWAKKFEQHGLYIPVWLVKTEQLAGWIAQRMRSRGLRAERNAVSFLASQVDGNLLAAAQEIDKLLLANGEGDITLAQVEQSVSDSSQFDAFKLSAALLSGNAGRALRITRSLRQQNVPMPMVIAALEREFMTLMDVMRARQQRPLPQVYRELRIWDSRQKVLNTAMRFLCAEQLQSALITLARLDQVAKGRAFGDFWVELESLLISLLPLPKRRRTA